LHDAIAAAVNGKYHRRKKTPTLTDG